MASCAQGPDHDNVAACQAWVDAQQCGGQDFAGDTDCQSYESTQCNVADYFDCLSAHTVCESGELETTGWMACIPLIQCN